MAGAFRPSKKLAARSFPPKICTVCLLAFGSPGGKRRKESLAAQGCRTHRACRWVRSGSRRAAALRHHPWGVVRGVATPLTLVRIDRLTCGQQTYRYIRCAQHPVGRGVFVLARKHSDKCFAQYMNRFHQNTVGVAEKIAVGELFRHAEKTRCLSSGLF